MASSPSTCKLYDYQQEAVDKLKYGSILCGGVGSGKSRTSLAYFQKATEGKKDLYIITTARKRDTKEWDGEYSIFGFEGIKIVVDSWNNIRKYVDIKDSFFIFDEQRVVGSGIWVKSFLKITKSNEWILLSATPGDTWMDYIPVFVANGFYKNRTAFLREHAVYDRYAKYPKVERFIGTGKLLKYRKQILVNMDYKNSSEQINKTVFVDYDKELYKTVWARRWNPYDNEPIRESASLCYLVRKVTNSDPSRIEAVKTIFYNHRKVIVFYNFNYELELLRKMCKDEGFLYSEWNGFEHEPIPKGDSWLYLVQYAAGAEGWNCIETNTIIFFSQNYSYKTVVQAAGRIDRLNTPFKNLYYYHLRSNSPIDRGILTALKHKKKFNESEFLKA